jgi:hypothetical protein
MNIDRRTYLTKEALDHGRKSFDPKIPGAWRRLRAHSAAGKCARVFHPRLLQRRAGSATPEAHGLTKLVMVRWFIGFGGFVTPG